MFLTFFWEGRQGQIDHTEHLKLPTKYSNNIEGSNNFSSERAKCL